MDSHKRRIKIEIVGDREALFRELEKTAEQLRPTFDAIHKITANIDTDAAAEAFDFYETLPPELQEKFGNWTAKELLAFGTLIEDGLE